MWSYRKDVLMDTDFEKELEQLINKHSVDAKVGMPDFVIAQYLVKCLTALFYAVKNTEGWKK
jgi:hypothetical protein